MRFSAPTREEILHGPALWVMARIGGPAVVSSLLFTLYNLADAFWIGRLPKEESAAVMAGIQVSWPIVRLLISLVAGFGGAAVSALVAQYMRAGREREANYSLNQLFGLVLLAGIAIGLVGYLLSPWLLNLLVGEGAVAAAAVVYLRVIFLVLLARGRGQLRLQASAMRPHWPWAVKALRIGLPAAIGQSSTAFGFVVMTAVIGRLPDAEAALAGYGIADRILGILFIVTDDLSTGLTTMVGQALGARLMSRAREIVKKGLVALIAILTGEAALLWLLRRPLVAMFIPGRPDVIAVGASFIQAFAVGMPLLGVFFAALAIYRGAGHNLPTMILSMLRLWALRIPLAYLFGYLLGWGRTGSGGGCRCLT
ncbi:hypothetical protein LR090_06740 [Candidatus Bipolaricaulota bacterium]|nr:hypothetical protein [Candidatus Bipolaricaulota bacterium]